jgi:hypothetical protein
LPVAQQDMRFCGAQRNKKCLKSFLIFGYFLSRKSDKRIKKKAELPITGIDIQLF